MNIFDRLLFRRIIKHRAFSSETDERLLGVWQSDRDATLNGMALNPVWWLYYSTFKNILGNLKLSISKRTITLHNAEIEGARDYRVVHRRNDKVFVVVFSPGSEIWMTSKIILKDDSFIMDSGHWWGFKEHFRRIE